MRTTTRRGFGFAITLALAGGLLSTSPAFSAAGFGDVAGDAYYTEAVQWMADNDITTGTTEGCYSPGKGVTRGEVALFIWRMAEQPAGGYEPFSDVPDGFYAQEAIAWMVKEKITLGTSSTTFSPDQFVSRAEAGTFLWRWQGRQAGGPEDFTDVPSGEFYSEAVAWMVKEGITTGTSDTTFDPHSIVNRAQIAAFLYRLAGEPPVNVEAGGTCGGGGGGGTPPGAGGGSGGFETLPPGSALPSGAECATRVKSAAETRSGNATYNSTPGTTSNDRYPRVDGNFVGTTDEILQWVACKWGLDEDIVRAQAVKESYWDMTAAGDRSSDQSDCHPDLRGGSTCPESIGILQVRYLYHSEAFEDSNAIRSTAYNADYTYAVWRDCYEGNLGWLGGSYEAGDVMGCLGVWFTGRWYPSDVWGYLSDIEGHIANRTWETAPFLNYSS